MQGFGQDRDEGISSMGWNQRCDLPGFFPLHQSRGNQLFQNPGAGGRGSNALSFRILGHILCARRFHAVKYGIFRIVFRRGCFALLYTRFVYNQRRSFRQSIRE